MAAPLGEFAARVPKDVRRVKPRPSVKLHASKLEEAVAVDRYALHIPIGGRLSSGEEHHTEILIPQAFTYLLTKLCAFRDRMHDADRSLGQHHALDIYRIVAMLTREEDADVRCLSQEFSEHAIVLDARRIAAAHFTSRDGLGLLRIQEHALYQTAMDLRRFSEELDLLLGTGTSASHSHRKG